MATLDRTMAAWRDVLGHDEFDPDSDFFDAGGNSATAVRMLVRLEEEFGVRVRLADLLRAGTPRRIAALIDSVLTEVGEGGRAGGMRGTTQ